jgi:hypothetical protein
MNALSLLFLQSVAIAAEPSVLQEIPDALYSFRPLRIEVHHLSVSGEEPWADVQFNKLVFKNPPQSK